MWGPQAEQDSVCDLKPLSTPKQGTDGLCRTAGEDGEEDLGGVAKGASGAGSRDMRLEGAHPSGLTGGDSQTTGGGTTEEGSLITEYTCIRCLLHARGPAWH